MEFVIEPSGWESTLLHFLVIKGNNQKIHINDCSKINVIRDKLNLIIVFCHKLYISKLLLVNYCTIVCYL